MATRRTKAATPWSSVRQLMRDRGLRWTPQRRALIDVLAESDGHVTSVELIERCRALNPETIPSTVYRTLDVLEELGLIRHGHGADGREEFHVLPESDHGHLHCSVCAATFELGTAEAAILVRSLRISRGFEVDLSHVTMVGLCGACGATGSEDRQPEPAATAAQ